MSERVTPRVFFDTSAVIAGSFSGRGASYILMQLSGLTLIDGRISEEVRTEAERNVTAKLPSALPILRILLKDALKEGPPLQQEQINAVTSYADTKDIAILAAAVAQECHFLVTLNERDFWPPPAMIKVIRPGDLLNAIRGRMTQILEE